MKWKIPLLIGDKPVSVLGQTQWITIAPRIGDKPTLANAMLD